MKTTIITVLAASALLAGCGDDTTSTPAAAVPGATTAGSAATGTASTGSAGTTQTNSTATGSASTKSKSGATTPKTASGGSTKTSTLSAGAREGKLVAKGKSIGSASKSGKEAFVTVKETIKDPSTIKLKVTSQPAQKTKVMWTMSCKKGSDSRIGGANYEVSKSSTQTLEQPLSGGKSCTLSALAQLTKRGKIKLEILG